MVRRLQIASIVTGAVVLGMFALTALGETKQVTFNTDNATFRQTVLEAFSDGGCSITQCYETVATNAGIADCVTFYPTRVQVRNACQGLVELAHRRVLSRTFPVDGGE